MIRDKISVIFYTYSIKVFKTRLFWFLEPNFLVRYVQCLHQWFPLYNSGIKTVTINPITESPLVT